MSDGSTGRILGTIVGAVAGYFTGGASFVALGATLGGAAGSLLDPKKRTETNKIDDIKVSVSKYGDGIPETWGNNIPTATWIWTTYVIEIGTDTEVGKGGGTVNTNYQQFIYGTLCFGRTPPPGVPVMLRKAWIDGKLNYDASYGLSSSQALANEENPFQQLILRDGNPDQLPWALTEQWEGVGNVPANRGKITGEIFGLQVPGGRIPQIAVELCVGAILGPEITEFAPSPAYSASSTGALIGATSIWEWSTIFNGFGNPLTLTIRYGSPGSMVEYGQMELAQGGYTPYPVAGSVSSIIAPFPDGTLQIIDLSDRTSRILFIVDPDGAGVQSGRAAYDSSVEKYVVSSFDASSTTGHEPVIIYKNSLINCDPLGGDGHGPILGFFGGMVHAVVYDGVHPIYVRRTQDGFADPFYPDIIGPAISYSSRWSSLFVDGSGVFVSVLDSAGASRGIYKITEDWELLCESPGPGAFSVFNSVSNSFWSSDNSAITGPSFDGTSFGYNLVRFKTIIPVEASVADFIESQSLRSGLDAEQIDVSDIEDTFWGLTLKAPDSARGRIAPLLTYGAIGVVQEDGLLRYFHRASKTFVTTIAYEELGFAQAGDEPGDPFPLVRNNAQELPRSVTVTYNDPNFDYQTSTVKAMRYAVDSELDVNETLDMAMDGDKAASIARRILFERWVAQMTRSCAVSRQWADLSAGDVIRVEYPRGIYSDWMTSKITDTGLRIEIECFPADGDLVIQTVPGPSGFRGQQIDPLVSALRLQPLDIPILRDQDDNAGLYVAIDSYANEKAEGELFVGNDDASLVSRGTVNASAPIGFAETALSSSLIGFVDEKNLFTVNIGDDVFESCTRDELLANEGEFWALGAPGRWLIGTSALGDSLGNGRFILSRHLVGLFGTERFTTTSRPGDTFVLLRPVGMLRPSMSVGEIGQSKRYRAVAKGRSFNSASSISVTNTGEGLKPLSPINLRRSNSNDLSVDRRSRLSIDNSTGLLPIGEESEAFSWSFYSSSAFTTLIGSAVTSSATITAAQITAAGATPSSALYVRVAQISESVGRGSELQATV